MPEKKKAIWRHQTVAKTTRIWGPSPSEKKNALKWGLYITQLFFSIQGNCQILSERNSGRAESSLESAEVSLLGRQKLKVRQSKSSKK